MTDPDPNEIRKDIPPASTKKDSKATQSGEESSGNKTNQQDTYQAASKQKTSPTTKSSNQSTNTPASSVKGNLTAAWLSYGALSDIAVTIAYHLKDHLTDNVLVSAGDSILTDLRQWLLFESVLSGAQTYCDSILAQYSDTEPVQTENLGALIQTGLGTGTAILTALSGLFALFKTTVTTTQHHINLDHDAIISAIVSQILVVKPGVGIKSLRSMELRSPFSSQSTQSLAKLMHSRSKATLLVASQKGNPVKKVELEALVQFIDQVVRHTPLFAGSETAGSIINGEKIHKALADDNTFLLDLKPIIGGGDQIKIERTFFHTDEFYVNGVAAVSYTLVDSDGNIIATGNIHGNTGYKRYDMVNTGIWETSIPRPSDT